MSSLPDAAARLFAADPARNVVLEASAGTGKTTVLVARYVNLLRAGVDPSNILAITFTRQAAAEMRERILAALRREAEESAAGRARWLALRDRLGDVTVSTVDAFCLSLLREFPLEADLDPEFGLADETETPGLMDDAVQRALRLAGRRANRDPALAMLLARLGERRAADALRGLLERREVVRTALAQALRSSVVDPAGAQTCRHAATRLAQCVAELRREAAPVLEPEPPCAAAAAALAQDLQRAPEMPAASSPLIRAWIERLRSAFLTRDRQPRRRFPAAGADAEARRRYQEAAAHAGSRILGVIAAFDDELNLVLVRAARTLFEMTVAQYEQMLRSRLVLDFTGVLQRTVDLLRRMDEFARSRFRLESRYHHLLLDEFQDTSRLQWELVSLLVRSWSEGSGLADDAPLQPSIFVVGDRKQSIYRFRDADVGLFRDASEAVAALRPGGDVRRSIAHSFRADPPLLRFVNDLFTAIGADGKQPDEPETFRYAEQDRFPLESAAPADGHGALGLVVAHDADACARAVANEVNRLLTTLHVIGPHGDPLGLRPEDVAILFRARGSHRLYEKALEAAGVPTCVYRGLGFAEADEVQDVLALIRFLAQPASELRAAALLRSRLLRISDTGLLVLAGNLSAALADERPPPPVAHLDPDDRRVLDLARRDMRRWLALVDNMPPAELIERVLQDTAYACELRGRGAPQALANLRRLRGLVRRIQNRGYATMARVAEQLERLSAGMANAAVEARGAVSLMTVHAAKGLEFPVVFLVDIGRGTRADTPPVRVAAGRGDRRPHVTVWPHRSAADDMERRRELEEVKRLLYVALTRARNRLYLAAATPREGAAFRRDSFGGVLPQGLQRTIHHAGAASAERVVAWQASGMAAHHFVVCADCRTPSPAEEEM